MEFTPIKDLLISLRHKHRQMLETCWTRKDKLYAQGYKDALDDVLRGALNIQNTFNVHYTIRDKSPEGVYKEMEEHDKERY